MFVPIAISHIVVVAVPFCKVIADEPSVRTLVFELLETKRPKVQVWLFVSKVPLVRVMMCVVNCVKASCSWNVPPAPSNVMEDKEFPAVVIRHVPEVEVKSILAVVPAAVVVYLPEASLKRFPATVIATSEGCEIEPACPVQSRVLQAIPVASVQTPVELASKNTSSEVVGTAAPPAPPEVVAHLEPAVPSHVAVPPTQNLFAI